MINEKDKSVFDFWLVYEKLVGKLPEKTVNNPQLDEVKKTIIEKGMLDISFNSVILPFSNKKKQEESLRNMLDILTITGKIKEFDYDKYYDQYLNKQKEENKELPLTDFVQILIDDNIIPAMDYKKYEEKILNKKTEPNKFLNKIQSIRENQETQGNVYNFPITKKIN